MRALIAEDVTSTASRPQRLQAVIEAAAAPLTAATVAGTAEVGTGILDATGQEIMRDVTTHGPSVARQILSHPLTQSLLARVAGYGGAGFILKKLGVF